jgi:hypothetical protein
MTFEQFKDSVTEPSLSAPLRALWQDAKGNWEAAHTIAQEEKSAAAAWVHAYLHRKEGDSSNARYWYGHAQKPESDESLETEWEQIARELLEQS